MLLWLTTRLPNRTILAEDSVSYVAVWAVARGEPWPQNTWRAATSSGLYTELERLLNLAGNRDEDDIRFVSTSKKY